jgi:hypothetical protein
VCGGDTALRLAGITVRSADSPPKPFVVCHPLRPARAASDGKHSIGCGGGGAGRGGARRRGGGAQRGAAAGAGRQLTMCIARAASVTEPESEGYTLNAAAS